MKIALYPTTVHVPYFIYTPTVHLSFPLQCSLPSDDRFEIGTDGQADGRSLRPPRVARSCGRIPARCGTLHHPGNVDSGTVVVVVVGVQGAA